ncbi:hypothetical protein TIFTF001_012076 [Ficus carica]|uniref:F-box domain-containing protein n=1 Tax=Ficus carica TaxID=3494 RepID=A0AA88DI03_FICCA|nr:hypothetical protein TIFTF001_012076 [Ficus carica]
MSETITGAFTDDVLLEILIRLPEFQSTIQYDVVCKRWLSITSQPQFICSFTRHHNRPRFPLLLRKISCSPSVSHKRIRQSACWLSTPTAETTNRSHFGSIAEQSGLSSRETCNGVAHWILTEHGETCSVAAFDPFKGADHPLRCHRISMPVGYAYGKSVWNLLVISVLCF